jgi:hypothetical protein
MNGLLSATKFEQLKIILELIGRKFSPSYIAKIVAYCMCALIFVLLNTKILFEAVSTLDYFILNHHGCSHCIVRW